MPRRLLTAGLALLAAGCALGPNYKRPEVPVPPTWRDIPVAEAESLANSPWWEIFEDPKLQELVKIALVENKDLKIAVERVEEARARYGFTKADFWPKVDLSGTAGRLRFNAASLLHTPEGDQAAAATETPIYALSADMSWEVDFFGRVRRATEACWLSPVPDAESWPSREGTSPRASTDKNSLIPWQPGQPAP
jgi:multidrug efflux system outer membrane protein